MKRKKNTAIGVMVFLLLGSASCIPVGDLQEDSRTVKLQGVQSAEVELEFHAGEIKVCGGTEELMEGVFEYNIEQWSPEIKFNSFDSRGFLYVSQGNSSGIPAGNGKNIWDIYLNEEIALDLDMDLGAGEGDLNLQHLNLRSVRVDMGVGDLDVDVSGSYDHDVDVTIDGGVGSITLYLPKNIGVIVNADKGIGSINSRDFIKKGDSLVNKAYMESDVEIRVDIDAGIGSIKLKLR
ncbi:MAG: hypothetical protein GF421_10680 [Candidatus Aminicenantes bacterium]|nr:hypothetical protein [Candidatus Aminicenantes bacterium]